MTSHEATESRPLTTARVLPHRIVLAVDGSPLSDQLVAFTAALAAPFGSAITALRVLGGQAVHGRVDAVDFELERAEAERHLQGVVDSLGELEAEAGPMLVEGRAAEQIVRVASERDADLLVMSSHGEGGLTAWNLGGTAQKLVQCQCCSLLVVPSHHGAFKGFKRLLVPLDGSKRSECVLPLVEALAKHHGSEVTLYHAAVSPELPRRALPSREDRELVERLTERNVNEARSALEAVARRLRARDITAHVQVEVAESAFRAIAAASQGTDLLVLSAHGATGDPADRHGGLPTRLLLAATVPTLVVQDLPRVEKVQRTPSHAQPRRASPFGATRTVLHFAM